MLAPIAAVLMVLAICIFVVLTKRQKQKAKKGMKSKMIIYSFMSLFCYIILKELIFGVVWKKQGQFKLSFNLIFILCKAMAETSSLCEITSVESLQYDLDTIRTATNNFSEANKLGQGGFGVVYKVASPLALKLFCSEMLVFCAFNASVLHKLCPEYLRVNLRMGLKLL